MTCVAAPAWTPSKPSVWALMISLSALQEGQHRRELVRVEQLHFLVLCMYRTY